MNPQRVRKIAADGFDVQTDRGDSRADEGAHRKMPPLEPDEYPVPATRPQRLVLVRHAESTRNVARGPNRFFLDEDARRPVFGMPDHAVPLTPAGERHAEATGVALRAQFGVFDYVYHSGYRRAEQTAQAILAAYAEPERDQMPVRHNLFLRERDTGYAYDMTTAEAEAAFPLAAIVLGHVRRLLRAAAGR